MKKSDDGEDQKEKLNFSRTQLLLIGGSIAAVAVLAFALSHLVGRERKNTQEQATVVQSIAPPIENPPAKMPEEKAREEIGKLEQTLPKQVQSQPAGSAPKGAPEADRKTQGVQPPPATPVTERKPQPVQTAPLPVPSTGTKNAETAQIAPATPVLKEKNVSTSHAESKGKKKETTAKERHKEKTAKVKLKKIPAISHKKAKPVNKRVDVKTKKSKRKFPVAARSVEPKRTAVETRQAPLASAEPASTKKDTHSFTDEPSPPALAPAAPIALPPAQPAPAPATTKTSPAVTAPPAAPDNEATAQYTVFAGIFSAEADAKNLEQNLNKKGFKAYITRIDSTKNIWYRVMVGAYTEKEEAEKAANAISASEGLKAKVQHIISK